MFLQYPRESLRYFHTVLVYGHICGPVHLALSLAALLLTAGRCATLTDHAAFLCVALRTTVSVLQTPVRFLMSLVLFLAARGGNDAQVADRLMAMKDGKVWRAAHFVRR